MPGDGDEPPTAEVELKLEKQVDPLPVDSTMIIRPRSALGLKYIEITPGRVRGGLRRRRHDPGGAGHARAGRDRRRLQHLRREGPARLAAQPRRLRHRARRPRRRHQRGDRRPAAAPDLPAAGGRRTWPIRTRSSRASSRRSGDAAAEVAPVAETQASLFVNLDTTFTALASVARPFIQESISNSPPAEDAGIRGFPQQRPFLRNSAALFRELKPGVDVLPATRADPGRRARDRHRHARAHAGVQRAARGRLRRAQELRRGAARRAGHRAAERHGRVAAADARLPHARPDRLQLRDALVPQHLEPAVGGRPERHLAAVHHHRDAAGPEQRGRPVERAGQRRRADPAQLPAREQLPEHGRAGPDA